MKINKWKIAAVIILIMPMLLSAGAHMANAASKYVVLETVWEDGRKSHVDTLLKDGVTYGSFFTLGSAASLRWGMEGEDTAFLSGNKKRIVVHMGSRFAEVDGQKVDMGREPVWYISHLYVPIRFLAAVLDGEVAEWNKETGKVTVTGLKNYNDTFYGSMMGHSYMIRAGEGDLEITNVYTGHKDSIPLGLKDMNVNTHNLTLNFKWTPKNLLIVTVVYADRMTGDYDLHTLVFKNQGLIRKAVAHGLTEQHENMRPDGKIQLIDDNYIRVIEDETGNVLEVNAR
ncbi:stalk domain-containing protein [Paenibacillus thermotolerans]|uniref:stalk domain-containing protein n=1 Tax=Paenibacillus thermotolerans TaxID=3027807 RepID=UPI002368B151|nr:MULTISPECIES: stalk domain-containing protein [unclassified Paenibacillus]